MSGPFHIEGPALISFSGGRSSAYMLWRILDAHNGDLPQDGLVCFANTGKELPETLAFVNECASRWGVRVRWVEYRDEAPGFAEVGFNSASRDGAPFKAIIAKKKRLPNWQERWCTTWLKIKPMHGLMRSELGLEPGSYLEPVGLRFDEAPRIGDMVEGDVKTGRRRIAPLSRAKVTKADVMAFWKAQPFDLGLEAWEGNCDACFATGRAVRIARLRRRPEIGKWWADMEAAAGGVFDRRDSVAALMAEARQSPDMFEGSDLENDVECGLHCGASS